MALRKGISIGLDIDVRNNVKGWKYIYMIICLMTLIWLTFHQFYTVPSLYSSYNKPVSRQINKIGEYVSHITTIIESSQTRTYYGYNYTKDYIRQIFSGMRIKHNLSCKKMFENDKTELFKASGYMLLNRKKEVSTDTYVNATKDCHEFKHQRSYFVSSVTHEEKYFPLAYSILAYRNTEQIERLLRAIYRPQNFYCIHLDNKTDFEVVKAVKAIASCFKNVFVSKTSLSVRWGSFAVLGAELACMKELWEYKGWKYFINLTGQEFPLKTNLELVRILKAMKGANIVGGSKNRNFVDFALHDNRSLDFIEWLKRTQIPDESFFSTLNYNPQLGIPGSFLGDPEEYPEKPLITRYKNWHWPNGDYNRPCSGKYIHKICITGVGDLHRVSDALGLFLNKVFVDYQPLAFDCLEELILNRTLDQYLNHSPIDVSRYSTLDQVKYRLVK